MKTTTSLLTSARTARTAKTPVVVETNDPNAPITIGEGRARVKRARLSGAQFKAARAQAVAVTGYDATSPIYGKQLPEVIDMISEAITEAGKGAVSIQLAQDLLAQLKARAVTRKLIGQARS